MGVVCSCFKQTNQRKIIQDPNESQLSSNSSAFLRAIKGRTVKNSIIIHKNTMKQKKTSKVLPDQISQTNQNVETTQLEPYSLDQTFQQNFETQQSEKSNSKIQQDENFKEDHHIQDLEEQQNKQVHPERNEESKSSDGEEEIKSFQ